MASDLSSFIAIVQEIVKQIPGFRKSLSTANQYRFSTALSLVGYCIRTGYLVDLLSPSNPIDLFSSLLHSLRSNPTTQGFFAHVVHLYEPVSDQTFFVNMMLLAPLVQSYVADTGECAEKSSLIIDHLDHTFIRFQTPFEILDSTPVQVLRILTSLLSLVALPNCPLSFSLPDDITIESAVPLAAILLDYPVAYVPTSTENNILSNVPLNFYECLLIVGGNVENQRHEITIMKFSCPAELTNGQGRNLDPDRTVKLLQNIFSARLEQIGETSLGITVQLSTQTVELVVI